MVPDGENFRLPNCIPNLTGAKNEILINVWEFKGSLFENTSNNPNPIQVVINLEEPAGNVTEKIGL